MEIHVLESKTHETGYETLVVEPGTLAKVANGETVTLLGKTYSAVPKVCPNCGARVVGD